MVKSAESEDNVYWLTKVQTDIDRRNPIIETRYYVVEVTPSKRYNQGNGHGGYEAAWTNETVDKVSPYFRTKRAAVKWMSEHEPDEGKTLAVMRQHLRRTITEKWWSPHKLRT